MAEDLIYVDKRLLRDIKGSYEGMLKQFESEKVKNEIPLHKKPFYKANVKILRKQLKRIDETLTNIRR